MTEQLATSDEGRRWLPSFGDDARGRWGDGTTAVKLIRRIVSGDADPLSGRVVFTFDDLAALPAAAADEDVGRLRIQRLA